MLSEMLLCMDVPNGKIKLHPGAKNFLFENFLELGKIFTNVLGLVETDYISIAVIDQTNQLFFLSSKPSIEHNLIDHGLWQQDGSYQPHFVFQDEPCLWSELYSPQHANELKLYKQEKQKLIIGISIPSTIDQYRVIFSFGFKSFNDSIQQKKHSECRKLLAMGKYCLKEIRSNITFPTRSTKPHLKLIINNKDANEPYSRER